VNDTNKVKIGERSGQQSNEPAALAQEINRANGSAAEDLRKVEEMFERAQLSADVILNSANSKASRIIAEAKVHADSLAQEIKGEAYERGYAEGRDKGTKEGERLKCEAEAVLEEARRRREEIVGSVERDVVELIAKLLDKLLVNTIEINPGIVAMLVRGHLSNMNVTGNVILRVSPDDYDEVIGRRDEIAAAVDSSVTIEIAKDVTFKKAECVLETPLGSMDISLESSCKMVKDNLTYLFKMGELYGDH